jgi:hypothetical protein
MCKQFETDHNNYHPRNEQQDDEMEFGRVIPIHQSDDSSDDAYLTTGESSSATLNGYQEEDDTFINCMNTLSLPDQDSADEMATIDMAFKIGPKKDGIIYHHSLSPIPIHANPYSPWVNRTASFSSRVCRTSTHLSQVLNNQDRNHEKD